MLLIGAPGSGKTMVAQAIAHSVGAALFDLSPKSTDGKWPGKAAATMVRCCPLTTSYNDDSSLWNQPIDLPVPAYTQFDLPAAPNRSAW